MIRPHHALLVMLAGTASVPCAAASEQDSAPNANVYPQVSAHYRRLHGHCFEQRTVLSGETLFPSSAGLLLAAPSLQVSRRLTPCPEVVLMDGKFGQDDATALWTLAGASGGDL